MAKDGITKILPIIRESSLFSEIFKTNRVYLRKVNSKKFLQSDTKKSQSTELNFSVYMDKKVFLNIENNYDLQTDG